MTQQEIVNNELAAKLRQQELDRVNFDTLSLSLMEI